MAKQSVTPLLRKTSLATLRWNIRSRCFVMHLSSIAILISAVLLASLCCAETDEAKGEMQQAMAARLSRYPAKLMDAEKNQPIITAKDLCLAAIYHETGARPLWVDSNGPGVKASIIQQYLRLSFREGVDPKEYEAELIESLFNSRKPDDLAQLDILITYNLVKYIHDMSFGRMEYRRFDPELFAEVGNEFFNPVEAIKAAISSPDLGAFLESLVPVHKYYSKLKESLPFYRTLADKDAWRPIPSGNLIRPGDQDQRLTTIRQRLSVISREKSLAEFPETYEGKFVEAVKKFQQDHGLRPDGIIGPRTLSWLNKTPEELINIICINMARWRWQAHDLGKSYIMVNIAGFSLKAVRNNEIELEMPVIVGKLQHKTPVFSDKIRYLDFNPYWNLPRSIARDEELPALRKNSRHLADRHIRVFSSWHSDAVELDPLAIDWNSVSRSQISGYKLRQDPGPWNALGRVKFVFPNHHSIYLHDTPANDLFRLPARAFSHGCIRVSQPLKLALFCLQNEKEKWSVERIEQIVSAGTRRVVSLSSQLPVHITYQTAWFDRYGSIRFNDDIYGRDSKVLEILTKR